MDCCNAGLRLVGFTYLILNAVVRAPDLTARTLKSIAGLCTEPRL